MNHPAHEHFRFAVLAADATHALAALFWGERVGQGRRLGKGGAGPLDIPAGQAGRHAAFKPRASQKAIRAPANPAMKQGVFDRGRERGLGGSFLSEDHSQARLARCASPSGKDAHQELGSVRWRSLAGSLFRHAGSLEMVLWWTL